MGTLGYTATMSLDGYVADASGDFQWTAPTAAVFDFHLERLADVAVEVLGRRTYELMRYWMTYDEPDGTPAEHEFARRWRALDKVVVSSTMTRADLASERDRLVPALPLAELQEIVTAAPGVVEIFGPTTAAPAIRAGLVDLVDIVLVPMVVGGGLRAFPDDVRLELRVVERAGFDGGATVLRLAR